MTLRPVSSRRSALAVIAIAALGSVAPAAGPAQQRTGPSSAGSLPPLAVTQLDERQRGLDLDARTLSLRTADPLPVRDVLILLLRDTDFSVVPDPDVEGAFSGELKNVSLRQALDLVLHPLRLEYAVQGTSIRVFRRRVETRLFGIDYVLTRRSAYRSMAAATVGVPAADGLAGLEPRTGRRPGSATGVDSVDGGDVFDELAAGIRTLLSPDGRFNLDRKAALLQVSDYPDQLDRISLYLDAVRARVLRQVLIEAKVLEIQLSDAYAGGIDWGLIFGDRGGRVRRPPSSSAGLGLVLDARVEDAETLVHALAAQGRVTVLSSPRVVAMNNEPALMRVGTQDVYFLTTTQIDPATGRAVETTVTPQAVTEGVVLSVTPQIGADGAINMSIAPSVTERTGVATSRFGDRVPVLSVRETDTLVRVHAGETIVLAGLMQQRPAAPAPKGGGRKGRPVERTVQRSDLVILLTPTILTPGQVAAEAVRERQRLEAQQTALVGAATRGGKR